ncbi:MAG: excinuclease ABC subunit UvrB [Nanoarchaeota archaeon]
MKFKLVSGFKPAGGQGAAIEKLTQGYTKYPCQTLLGITGSGKTFVMANLIEKVQKPTLVLAHNKTLAAQLYGELKAFFPENRVEYFISYYDYYQPESYLPTSDTYIEKDSSVNEEIEKMRLKTTTSLMARKDVIVVASISCIYGLGNPENFRKLSLALKKGEATSREQLIRQLVEMQYERSTLVEPGKFRVRGNTMDVFPLYDTSIIRIEFSEKVERLAELDSITGEVITYLDEIHLFPTKQFVVPQEDQKQALESIKQELSEQNLPALEQQRLTTRVKHDLEMMEEMGFCPGIENYSRHFDKRKQGEPPFVLLDYFPDDFLFIIDESHQTLPQSHAMYKGDYARKKNLIDFGFRLPSAFDNRPLKFEEFEEYFKHVLFVSATPREYETKRSGQVVELIIRPTGLLDPEVEVRPVKGQIVDLVKEIQKTVKNKERILVTTLTKRMAEDLTDFLSKQDIKVRYMHSEVESLDRIELIRQLRLGEFDVLVGINLLREGLDIPEVSLVAVLDADKEGYLRNEMSLIQTMGRAARNVHGRVILYADQVTGSMKGAMEKTKYRREAQVKFNQKEGITPETIIKKVAGKGREIKGVKHLSKKDVEKKLVQLDAEMRVAAEKLNFEQAIELRDTIRMLKEQSSMNEEQLKGRNK